MREFKLSNLYFSVAKLNDVTSSVSVVFPNMLGAIHNCHHFHERTQRTLGGRGSRATVSFLKCRF